MKQKIVICLVLLCLIVTCTPCAFALNNTTFSNIETEYFHDGSYAVIETIAEEPTISAFATTKTKSASRVYTYYNASDEKAWDFTLKGTFSYDGSSSKATAVSTSYNTYISGWKCSSKESSKSGATVTGTAKFKYNYILTKNITLGMKCSASGTISAV